MTRRQSAAVDYALRWLAKDPTRTRYKAAKKFGLSLSTVYRAVIRHAQEQTSTSPSTSTPSSTSPCKDPSPSEG